MTLTLIALGTIGLCATVLEVQLARVRRWERRTIATGSDLALAAQNPEVRHA